MDVILDAIRPLGQYDPDRMIQHEPGRASQSQGIGIGFGGSDLSGRTAQASASSCPCAPSSLILRMKRFIGADGSPCRRSR